MAKCDKDAAAESSVASLVNSNCDEDADDDEDATAESSVAGLVNSNCDEDANDDEDAQWPAW